MTNSLKALILLSEHNKINFDSWINQVLQFDEEDLKKALGTIEYLSEDTFLDIQEKLLDYANTLESDYENGDVCFTSHLTQVEFWGAKTWDFEPSDEEEQYFDNIEKLKNIALYY